MPNRNVLLIDDSKAVRSLMSMALERSGYVVQEAEDGEAAIELLDGRDISVIVCDLNMPRMDGLSFLRWLRVHPRYRKVPVAVLTTETRPEMKVAVKTGGANAYIRKPCAPGEFVDAVNRLCN
jgi:two-component system chemotaxis response regulator CheY